MPVTLVIGSQWGDEGKGKIIDYLAKDSDFVVRPAVFLISTQKQL